MANDGEDGIELEEITCVQPKDSPCSIFRVLNVLSRHNPKAYEPIGFSFGPFHYNKPNLTATHKIKLRYMHELISYFPVTNSQTTRLEKLMAAVDKVKKNAHECYEGSIDMSMDEFVEVLVVDGCFLIELFRKTLDNKLVGKDDPIFGVGRMKTMLGYDLVLLENQIPWLVLECLFNNFPNNMTAKDENLTLTALVLNYFGVSKNNQSMFVACENKHILHLLRKSFIFSSPLIEQKRDLNRSTNGWPLIPSATSLNDAGIKLKKAAGETLTSSALDIKFKNGVLEIPPIFIEDNTETLFRNLICLEQCLPHCQELISSYMTLFDCLIDNVKDVELLIKSVGS